MKKVKKSNSTITKVTVKTVASKSAPKPFPIVGFGASAGGLEAFSAVLNYLKEDLGMAYVLVMHLSPKHKSSLAEILQTKTKMKVTTVKNGIEIKMNNIYVIPPNTSMSIVDGHLKLAPRDVTVNGNFAIDYFLTALASVYKNNSIGVVLSGTASDGTFGLKAIKAEGGITFAQDDSAKFPGMPRSAYESGYADFVLSPEGIAKELSELAKIPYTVLPSDKVEKDHAKKLDHEKEILKNILTIVKSKTNIDFFSNYKQASIYRRIARRVVLHKLNSLEEYYSMLKRNEKEIDNLYNDFLINVTNFFRDEDFYKSLKIDIFPTIVKDRKETDPLRVWIAGCATGEEAYSVAITLTDYLESNGISVPYQIFASDLDGHAIEKARLGIYHVSALHNVPQEYIKRYFKKIDGHFQITKTIREVCIFSQQNLLKDPPFSRMDLISCQNVLIYLENEPQQKIMRTFHYALKPTGFLFLGKSETIGTAGDLFQSLNKKIRIYSRKANVPQIVDFSMGHVDRLPVKQTIHTQHPTNDLEREIGKVILTNYVMPCVLLNENLNIVQFFGTTSPYISPVVGKASFNILKMVREDLLIDLRTLILQAKKTGKIAQKEGIVVYNKKTAQQLSLEVAPKKMENSLYFFVIFKENQAASNRETKVKKRVKTSDGQKEKTIINLEDELDRSRELIRSTNEEYETTYEELQANNEQILSSNEELQSLNEELETSKEELQSANEELTTINEELQKRNVELKESQNYAKAIVDTVNSPFLVLTANLQVRIANKSFYETFKLSPDTTEGNFIYELGEHSWDIKSLREQLNDLLGRKTDYLEFKLEHFFPKVGDLVFIVNAYRLVKEDNSSETLILLAFNNIGDLLRSNLDLKNVNEQLEQFIFVSGHDLQEPLRKIQTFSNYLNDYEVSDSYIKENIDKINHTASKMSFLLRDLLSYSALLQNRTKSTEKVDLNKTLSDVIQSQESMIKEKEAEILISQLPSIVADAHQMNLLFSNLISNSLKFNQGKPVIHVTVETITSAQYETFGLNKDKNYVCIQVSDNGLGFNQKYISKIFSLFQRLHVKIGVGGTGMGLAMCKKIVEDHGGRILAEGRENHGATFSVFLPRG